MSTAVDSWDSWLEDQAAPKKRAVAGGNGEAAGDDTPQVHPVAQLDANAKDEFVKLAAEVEQAQRAAQAGKKSGNKGRKKREREEREPKKVVAVTSESFEALKQRLLAQTLEPVTEAATEGGGESNVKGVADGEAKVSKSKLKRQRKKAAAAKKQKQKKNAGGKQPAADSSDVVVAAATTTGTDSVINDGAASSHKAEKARGDEESVAAPSADAEAGAPSSAPEDPMCAIAERYLELWHESNAVGGGGPSKGPRRWKFKKAVQIWLLQNACYKQRLSGAGFKRFLKSVGAGFSNVQQTLCCPLFSFVVTTAVDGLS